MKKQKKLHLIVAVVCSMMVTAAMAAISPVDVHANNDKVAAQWNFDQSGVKDGSIQDKNLVIKDISGNGNDLVMNAYGNINNPNDFISFSEDTMYPGTQGSLYLNGDSSTRTGVDFSTVQGAPVNANQFENGYTIEFVYKLPKDWTTAESWMSLMARQGNANSMAEPQLGSMNMAISNCKEIQFQTANKDDSHEMTSSAWSVSMDKGDVWYHIAVVSDNSSIRVFVNGAEAFRDYLSPEMKGLYADPADGRFRIGSSWWTENGNTIDKFARGNYQQVRISEGALNREQWLISNPEQYIGNYGTNEEFKISNGGTYNMVFIPDTQNTIKFKGNVMDTAMRWLADNMNNTNMKAVLGLGDVVENWDDLNQWQTAASVFQVLPQGNVPFLIQPGNHDYGGTNYLDNFGVGSKFFQLSNNRIINDSPSGYSSYMTYDAGSYQYMMISLSMNHVSDQGEIDWFKRVLEKYPNTPTIVTSHDLQNCSDTEPNAIKLSPKGRSVWDIIKGYNQVFMMVGGHSHGAGHEILTNDAGNSVISMLADYQFAYNGGNAFLKFAEFNEAKNNIKISTFSPYAYTLGAEQKTFFDVNYLTGDGNYTEIPFNFDERFQGAALSSNAEQQGLVNGLVNDIDNLPQSDAVNGSHKEHVLALKNKFDSLSEDERKDFTNTDKLMNAYAKIVDIDKKEAALQAQYDALTKYMNTTLSSSLNEQLQSLLTKLQEGIQQARQGILTDTALEALLSETKTLETAIEQYVASKNETIEKPSGGSQEVKQETPSVKGSVKTGDTTSIWILLIAFMGSLTTICIICLKKKVAWS